MKQNWKRLMCVSALSLGVLAGGMPNVEAHALLESIGKSILGGIAEHHQLNELDNTDAGQAAMLKQRKDRTGVYNNYAYQMRAKRIVDELTKSKLVKRGYEVYVNPDEDFNASMALGRVMTINKGTMDMLDDDALAAVVGHELGHGEHKDSVNGAKKSAVLSTVLSAATYNSGDMGLVAAGVAENYLENQVFSVSQEKKADEFGFELLADSSFNVGGAAVAMEVIKNKYGELYTDGITQVIAPNNHPKTSQRILDNLKRLEDFSGKHVKVDKNIVFINGKSVYEGTQSGKYTPTMRAYLVAGKLARLYHDNTIGGARVDGTTVAIGSTNIVTMPNYDAAFEIAKNMNAAISDESGSKKDNKKGKK